MNITIDASKTEGLKAVVARLNAQNSEQVTPENYLLARIYEILENYTNQEIEHVKLENAEYFDIAAKLSEEKREQIKNLVQELSGV